MENGLQLVIDYGHKPATTSLAIADKFGKGHDDVLRSIRNLNCSKEFSLRNFAESTYELRGKSYPMYYITKDGFSFLAMGYTGATAAKFKEDYIDEFNRMEAELKKSAPKLLQTYTNRILSEPTSHVPRGYFCVFDKCHSIFLWIESNVGSENRYDLVDGSIGKEWIKYRFDKHWAKDIKKYAYEFNDQRGTRMANCFDNSELQHFEDWLKYTYRLKIMPDYLINKYRNEKNVVMLDRVNKALPKLLGGK